MAAGKSALDEFKRAIAIHHQWVRTARVTNNQRHWDLALTTKRIAEEWRVRALERSDLTPRERRFLRNGEHEWI